MTYTFLVGKHATIHTRRHGTELFGALAVDDAHAHAPLRGKPDTNDTAYTKS